jgi:hypothetical protein
MNRILEYIEFFWAMLTGIFSKSENADYDLRSRDVLIISGFGTGRSFYKKLEKKLSLAGYRPYIVTLPVWKTEKETIAHLTQALNRSGDRCCIIAHNTAGILMGGLPDSARRKVDTLVTLGTPYRGFKLLGFFSPKGWEPGSSSLEMRLPAYLFINKFHPLSPIQDYLFYPRGENLQYGQGRDQWFDIPGNYNLVRRRENLRTIVEYLQTINPPIPIPPVGTVNIQDHIILDSTSTKSDNKNDSKSKVKISKEKSNRIIAKKTTPKKKVAQKKTATKKNAPPKKKSKRK